jgi:hypothetical protein
MERRTDVPAALSGGRRHFTSRTRVVRTEMSKTLCFDLDGTLCTNTFGAYESAEPVPWAIERVNALAAAGHRIVILTARGSATGIDWGDETRAQLERWDVHHDELVFGKPSADVYVDDRAVHADAWRAGDAFAPPGFGGYGCADGALPTALPAHVPCVVETGRTFAGEPLRLDDHVRRLHAAAAGAGIPARDDPAETVTRVRATIAARRPAGDDVVYAISLSDALTAAHIDLFPPAALGLAAVACRPLAGVARALAPAVVAESGEVRVMAELRTRAQRLAGAWPLLRAGDGTVVDGLGCQLGIVHDSALRLQPPVGPPRVAGDWVRRLAANADLTAYEAAVTLDDLARAEEVLIVGLPFCLLPIATVDGRRIGDGLTGPWGARLLEAWSADVGVDIAAQTAELVRRGTGAEVARA